MRNPASDILHEVLVTPDEHIPLEAGVTYCGWKWAVAGAQPAPRHLGASSLPNFCKTCRLRASGDDSDASSEQPSDGEPSVLDDTAVQDDDILEGFGQFL